MSSIRLSTNAAGPTATLDSPRIKGEKKGIAVLTSGGDAQGMNAAVRAVVRTAIRLGADAFAIINGYQGMVDDNIKQLGWHDVGRILPEGGTFIGTARCAAFMTRDGRKQACKNLLKRGIDRLVIIGGDGSLTGASILHKEWSSILQEIIEDQKKDKSTEFDPEVILKRHSHLRIVGLVGSIDNDMCGTDMTIGADTALNHIVRAVDAIMSTAASHQRDFVVEVMGRNCGWLALYGCIATASDWMFIPERPVEDNWKAKMAQAISKGKKLGKKSTIVILAEGARDVNGNLITSDEVKKALDQAGYEARVTVLGHVQRGGSPTAWDRNMTTIQGWKAAELALLEPLDTEPQLVGIISNKIIVNPLHACLHQNAEITQAIKKRDFHTAMKLRGNFFLEGYDIARILTREKQTRDQVKPLKIGMLHAGACAPGMNSAARALVRLALNRGHRVFGINNGVEGLLTGNIQEMQWITVNGWAKQGGALLGTRRADPSKIDYNAFAEALVKQDLDALIFVGGWDGYEVALQFENFKKSFSSPKIQNFPIVLVPASISNNLPCSDFSIGCDTALNNIIEAVDKIKQSAVSSSRVFVVEVMGSNGYLAVMTAIATGADKVYIPEEKLKLDRLQNDIDDFANAFKRHTQSFLVINNESSSKVFTTPTLAKLFEDQSEGKYKVRTAVLGHLQQGGAPTGADRILATVLSQKAIQHLEEQFSSGVPKSGCIGTLDGNVVATLLEQMEPEMDMKKRRPKKQWWLQYKELCEWVTKAPNLNGNTDC